MSQPVDAPALLKALHTVSLIAMVSSSLTLYDYVLTLPVEIERFWKRPSYSWATCLFIVYRYLLVLGRIPIAIMSATSSSGKSVSSISCTGILSADQLTMVLVQLLGAVLMMMRVYALYDRNRWLLYMLTAIALGGSALAGWSVLSSPSVKYPKAPLSGCVNPVSTEQAIRLAGAWAVQLVFDALVFILTLWKTWHIGSVGGRPLRSILVRDGAMYFAIMTMANAGNIATLLLAPVGCKTAASRLTNAISGTMVCRLMLNLRDPRLVANSRPVESIPLATSIFPFETPLSMISPSSRMDTVTDTMEDTSAKNDISEISRSRTR